MSLVQRLILSVVPRSWGQAMEKDSRLWMMRCLTCGCERSIWDLGGIRYKAVGNKRKYYPCPKCGWTWHELKKKDEPLGASTPIN
jgi:hypothetical protein